LTTDDGPLARLVKNILAYIADAFGFRVEEGRIETKKLCVGAECIDEQELQQIRQLIQSRTVEPTPIPTSIPAETPTPDPTPTPTDTPSPTPEEPPPTATP
ncbi:MAG: hypothetical protein AAB375_03660, partial [Patescibacteria group bacterium]